MNENQTFVVTQDGSHTLHSARFDAHYHSVHGAVQESQLVYIGNGLMPLLGPNVQLAVLEMGFGTGLNAWLTLKQMQRFEGARVHYTAFELYPLQTTAATQLNYVDEAEQETFMKLHQSPWNMPTQIVPGFELIKLQLDLAQAVLNERYDLVYFDAFAPEVQPELWTEQMFGKLFAAMNSGGILVTYCSKGIVKNALRNVGFNLERLKGPPGKRHVLRARKDDHATV